MKTSIRSFLVVAALAVATPALAQTGLQLNGTNQSVTFGNDPSLNVSTFTVECWFMRVGTSANTSTGTGGWAAIAPLVTKGRGEAESPANLNMNYFLGIRSDGVLCADFEEGTGPNHPIGGTRVIPANLWHHAAVTYDVATGRYRLYLNGQIEKDTTLTPGISPASTSVQHAGLATAMTSAGATQGFFGGALDEVRIWNVARTPAQIAAGLTTPIASDPQLVARWGLDDGAGLAVANSVPGSASGTLVNGPSWVAGSPFALAYGLAFSGAAGNYVTFGPALPLDQAQWTVECWFRRDGAGVTANTGSGGMLAIPLVTKGGAESEGGTVDMNWFLGIRGSDNVLAADFEEGPGGAGPVGQNHPVFGTTPILAGSGWHHAAATYDGATWMLYLDGALEASLPVGQPAQSASIQHAGLGVSMTSTGTASGAFAGVLDEVRVWSVARSQAQIVADVNTPIEGAAADLVARWGMNEGAGPSIATTAGTPVNGTFAGTGVTWTAGAPFNLAASLPADPTGLSANAPAFNHVDVTWIDAATNESSYEIERSTSGPGGPWAPLATLPANAGNHADEPVAATAEYCYRVRAVNSFGESNWATGACATTPAEANLAFDFAGAGNYVTMGAAPELNLATFTVECWFRRDGAGTTTSTGTDGVTSAVPLVAKGRGEAEDPTRDLNWFLGIDAITGTLAADFEEGAAGANPSGNHPVYGVTPIAADGTWHHAAAAYDGGTWALYLDGCLETALFVGQPVASASTQHGSIGTALTSTGVAQGSFDGAIDEVKVWNAALDLAQVKASMTSPSGGGGMVGRWSLNDVVGAKAYATVGTNGTIIGAVTRPPGAPFADIEPPSGQVISPNGGETLYAGTDHLMEWSASDCFGVAGVDLSISRAGPAGPWEPIATGIPNAGSYLWNVTLPEVPSGGAHFLVRAVDAAGNEHSFASLSGFTIDPGATPTRVALFSVTSGPEGMVIRWALPPGEPAAELRVERAGAASGPWSPLGSLPRADGSTWTLVDRDVQAAREYWYRLAVPGPSGTTVLAGPIPARSERITAFALRGLAPNPTPGALGLELALPEAAHARVSVVDVLGRARALLLDAALPAGVHRLAWNGEAADGPLRPGVYFARAELGGRSFTRRFVVSR